MTFYILSLTRTQDNGIATWWKPNDEGYTADLDRAGKYTLEEIQKWPDYYDNGQSTRAIPCEEAEAVSSVPIVPIAKTVSLAHVAQLVSASRPIGKRMAS